MTPTIERAGARGSTSRTSRGAATRAATSRSTGRTAASTHRTTGQSGTRAPDHPGHRRPVAHPLVAAEQAVQHNSLHLRLPAVGELRLPAVEEVAFIGGVAVLAAIGVLEWPVAALLGIGHWLATDRRNKVIRAFGEALEEA